MSVTLTLATVKMKDGSAKLQLKTPYSPTLPAACRALGGKWGSGDKAWYFDPREKAKLRDLCLATFGIDPLADPDEAPELVSVRILVEAYNPNDALWLFGRELACQPGRDSLPRLGDGVILVRGSFRGGGSAKNPRLNPVDGTILEVRDVPRALVDGEIAAAARAVEVARASLDAHRARVAKLEARIAAGPTDDDRAMQILGPYVDGARAYLAPDEAGAFQLASAERKLQEERGYLASAEAYLRTRQDAIRIVEAAPSDAAQTAINQAIALVKTMSPAGVRSAVMSILATLPAAERRTLLTEITTYLDQGAV